MNKAITVARSLYAIFYSYIGAAWFSHVLLGTSWPDEKETQTAKALTTALTASGIVDPMIAATCLVGGVFLFFRRTAPLGIVILAPLVTGIFVFHITINNNWPWGTFHFVYLVILAWLHRSAFRSLWSYGNENAA
jgi:hypothetical protein